MSDDERKQRLDVLRKIPDFAAMDHRLHLNAGGKIPRLENLPRSERRRLAVETKKIVAQYKRTMQNLSKSGAGFPNDQLLRQLAIEYNHRYAASGIRTQPLNFNYFEPFCRISLIPRSVAPKVEIIEEYDHLYSLRDFLDYITSEDSEKFALESLLNMAEGRVFHFTRNGDIAEFSFLNSEGKEFLISGFSMVRHGNYLHWYMIGGELLTQDEWLGRCSKQKEINEEGLQPDKRAFLKDAIKINGNKSGEPVALEGTKTAVRTIISGEIDLITQKHNSRYYMTEYENTFSGHCDEPEVFEMLPEDKRKETIAKTKTELDKASVMWDLAEAFFQLPSYFSSRATIEREILDKSGQRLPRKKAGQGLKSKYKFVTAIEVTENKSEPIVKVNLPHYETETEGYWRRLDRGAKGRDQHGNEIEGKTWVKATNKWRERSSSDNVVFVKDGIVSAKIKIKEYQDAAKAVELADRQGSEEAQDVGELYVLRCAAMDEEIYKIGFTRKDSYQRAKQLSSATGVPLSFIVVKVWQHSNAKELEAEVHVMLDSYRVNDSREFFKVGYDVIENVVETILMRHSN